MLLKQTKRLLFFKKYWIRSGRIGRQPYPRPCGSDEEILMNSWRNPEELLATRAHLPRGIPFEYIYDGAAGGHAQRQVELLGREVGRLTDENERQGALVKE